MHAPLDSSASAKRGTEPGPVQPPRAEPPARAPLLARLSSHTSFWISAAIVVYLLVWATVYALYLGRRPPQMLRLEATLAPTNDHRSTATVLFSGDARVNLALADAQILNVVESSRTSVALPIAPSMCQQLAGIGGQCRGRTLVVGPPVFVSWQNRAGPITVTRDGVSQGRITLLDPNMLGVVSSGTTSLNSCIFAPPEGDLLQVQLLTSTQPLKVSVLQTSVTCSTGLRLAVAHGHSPPGRDAFLLEGLKSFDLNISADRLVVTGPKAGIVRVGDPYDLDRTDVVLKGDQIRARLTSMRSRQASLVIPPVRVRSARLAGEELVETSLGRHGWVTTAFFSGAGLIAALVGIGVKINQWRGGKKHED